MYVCMYVCMYVWVWLQRHQHSIWLSRTVEIWGLVLKKAEAASYMHAWDCYTQLFQLFCSVLGQTQLSKKALLYAYSVTEWFIDWYVHVIHLFSYFLVLSHSIYLYTRLYVSLSFSSSSWAEPRGFTPTSIVNPSNSSLWRSAQVLRVHPTCYDGLQIMITPRQN